MNRYTSEQTAYSPLKKKYVPLWRLHTNTVTVNHFNVEKQTEESKTYQTDFIRYHLHYSDSHCPDRLRRLVNSGKIIQYLDGYGAESQRCYLPSGGALETDRQLLSESCPHR